MARERNSEGLTSSGQQRSFCLRTDAHAFPLYSLIKINPWFLLLFVLSLQGASSARQVDDV